MALITINENACKRDALCIQDCPGRILRMSEAGYPEVIPELEAFCLKCGHCAAICPHAALALDEADPNELTAMACGEPVSAAGITHFLKSRRSVRIFKKKPVPHDELMRVLDVTRWAPTATNRQPVKWIVIETPDRMRELGRMIADGLRSIAYFDRMVEAYDNGVDCVLRGAPQVVIAYASVEGFDATGDCTISLAYLDLAAHAHGLGTCWAGVLTVGAMLNKEIPAFLAIPDGHKICGAMMIGYPQYAYARIPGRNPLQVTWK